jgi:Zn-dependent peptidase ImmA (M78 family)
MLNRGFKTRAENIALQIRKDLGLSKISPLSGNALADHLGVLLLTPKDIIGLSSSARTILLSQSKDSWSAVTISYGEVDMIIYNSSHSKARQSSDIMHELSHLLLNHAPSKFIVNPNVGITLRDYNEDQEDEATWLAGCLLLPREALLFIRKARINDQKAMADYSVSKDLLIYRTNVTGVKYQISGMYK